MLRSVCNSCAFAHILIYLQILDNNNNNDRLTAFDPGQPG